MSASARSPRSNPSSANVDDPKAKWTLPDNVLVRIQSDAAVTRNSELILYCSCYGLSRKVAYPDHFFCNGCERADQKELESIMLNKAKLMVNGNSTRYQCASRHAYFGSVSFQSISMVDSRVSFNDNQADKNNETNQSSLTALYTPIQLIVD
eukprot:scaffold43323_cov103-Attheya_sp.AAC.1